MNPNFPCKKCNHEMWNHFKQLTGVNTICIKCYNATFGNLEIDKKQSIEYCVHDFEGDNLNFLEGKYERSTH